MNPHPELQAFRLTLIYNTQLIKKNIAFVESDHYFVPYFDVQGFTVNFLTKIDHTF